MASADGVEDRTFRVNFSEEGVAKLRDTVMDKLKEFMGDYTDDTLVEYVIVLLRNGRRKEEARNELNVFLGDDSDSFVSWLWDHLATNVGLYLHPEKPNKGEATEAKPPLDEQAGRNGSHHIVSESEKGKSATLSRNRHKKEWKGLARDRTDPPPLRSFEVDVSHVEEKSFKFNRVRSSLSPQPPQQKKRKQNDERQQIKREQVSQATIDAPRRLLQFAVRDAVATLRPSVAAEESSGKRLRSVVATSTGDSLLIGQPRRIQSIAKVLKPMATVLKATQEAADDVMKVKSAGSVFDRLGCDVNASEATEQGIEYRDSCVEDEEYVEVSQIQEGAHSRYLQSEHTGGHVGQMSKMESGTGLTSDSLSDNEGYDGHIMGNRVINVSASGGNRNKDSFLQHGVAKNPADILQVARNKEQDQHVLATNTSHKIVNISVNVNTWKPPHFLASKDPAEMDIQKSVYENEAEPGKSGSKLMKRNGNPVLVSNGNVRPVTDSKKESKRTLPRVAGSCTAGRPLEDANSRTIFVSNVHFAATKDSLSRHFSKFGELLKVVIVTDATTGQPKGSAYVEFMQKEAADNALAFNGTSFMSRILKVVKRSSANQEASTSMTWPHIARGPLFAPARFSRAPFSRGVPGIFRPRLPMKPGARSLQWNRDAQGTAAESGTSGSVRPVLSPTIRSLTYVRTESKADGNSSTT